MTMPRPSLVTSSGPSPVRGFIAAMRTSSMGALTDFAPKVRSSSTILPHKCPQSQTRGRGNVPDTNAEGIKLWPMYCSWTGLTASRR